MMVVAEGPTDLEVAKAICKHVGVHCSQEISCLGKGDLDQKLEKYNNASKIRPVFVLRDLDMCDCPARLIEKKISTRNPSFTLRLAVRSIESWLLADPKNFADFFALPEDTLPRQPQQIDTPKHKVVTLCQRSRSREIKDNVCPEKGSGRSTGRGYGPTLRKFVQTQWHVELARDNSESLDRAIEAVKKVS